MGRHLENRYSLMLILESKDSPTVLVRNITPEVKCAVCKTGHHPFSMLRRHLDDEAFEILVAVGERAKAELLVVATGAVLADAYDMM